MPEGRTWGSTSAVDIDQRRQSIWVAERCAVNSCFDIKTNEMSPLNTVFKFDPNGKMVASFGQGMFVFPHGIHVDRDGNIWVTDGQDNLPRRRPGQPADAPLPPAPAKVVGHQVVKFSPEGKVLLTLGKPGGNAPGQPADPASFYQPNDVITYPNGDILVAEGHGNTHARLIRFDKQRQVPRVSSASSAAGSTASSTSRTAWRSIRRAGCSWPIARTTASRFSMPRPTRRSTPGISSAG